MENKAFMSNKLTIVMYHYVRRLKQSRYPRIKGLEFDLFIEQLQFISKHYNVVTMEQVIEAINDKSDLPNKAILLTFDDGYAEHFTHVYPVLKKMNMQGTFYVPAKTVLEHKVLDVNKVHFILASTSNVINLVDSIKEEIDQYRDNYKLKSYSDYYSELAISNRFDCKDTIFVKRMLQHALPEKVRNLISDKLFSTFVGLDEETFCKELYMDKFQLEQLVRDGMHVGCHGYDHYWWNKLGSNDLRLEIGKSKEFLQSIGCDMSKWTACYPYGSSSKSVVSELERQGCNLALTTEVRIADITNDNRLLLPRLDTNDLPKDKNGMVNQWY